LVDFEFKREVAILIGFLKRKRKRSLNVECWIESMDLPISIGILSIYIIGVRRHKESDLNDISIRPTNPDLNADIIT
jgi:hypothetical protein